MNEADVTKQIRSVLKISHVWHWKVWQGMGSYRGVSDIVGIHAGRFLAIEVKHPGWRAPGPTAKSYRHYKEQQDFLQHVRDNGGIGFFATSVDDVIRELGLKLPLWGGK